MCIKTYYVELDKDLYEANRESLRKDNLLYVKPNGSSVILCMWLSAKEYIKAKLQLLWYNTIHTTHRIRITKGVGEKWI